jgi:hypothetical protein
VELEYGDETADREKRRKVSKSTVVIVAGKAMKAHKMKLEHKQILARHIAERNKCASKQDPPNALFSNDKQSPDKRFELALRRSIGVSEKRLQILFRVSTVLVY